MITYEVYYDIYADDPKLPWRVQFTVDDELLDTSDGYKTEIEAIDAAIQYVGRRA